MLERYFIEPTISPKNRPNKARILVRISCQPSPILNAKIFFIKSFFGQNRARTDTMMNITIYAVKTLRLTELSFITILCHPWHFWRLKRDIKNSNKRRSKWNINNVVIKYFSELKMNKGDTLAKLKARIGKLNSLYMGVNFLISKPEDYRHPCYHCSFIANNELHDMKHCIEEHHTCYCPNKNQSKSMV